MTFRKSTINQLKRILFVYFYWITLAVIFIAGTNRVTLFALGYVIGCFYFLWVGNSIFLRPIRFALAKWNKLIIFNVSVILFKISLQVVGCVYMKQMYVNYCWVLQLLGIACLKTGITPEKIVDPIILAMCNVPHREAGIFNDGLCLAFLLIQRRIFSSLYFVYVVAEIKAQKFFASRGAEIIERITKKEVDDAKQREQEALLVVRRKMERIRKKHDENTVYTQCSNEFRDKGKKLLESQSDQIFAHKIELRDILPSVSDKNRSVKTLERKSEPVAAERRYKYSIAKNESQNGSWILSSDEVMDSKIIENEGGVKGLGPLQLLNYAFKKGGMKEAVEESEVIKATHTRMEQEMEDAFGIADHNAIRRAILRNKARREKADYDESTFNEDVVTRKRTFDMHVLNAYAMNKQGTVDSNKSKFRRMASADAFCSDLLKIVAETAPENERKQQENSADLPVTVSKCAMDVLAVIQLKEQGEGESDNDEMHVSHKEEGQITKQTSSSIFENFVNGCQEFFSNLANFAFLFTDGVFESLIENLMHLSRDYRYVTYILTTEKEIHKEISTKIKGERELRQSIRRQRVIILRQGAVQPKLDRVQPLPNQNDCTENDSDTSCSGDMSLERFDSGNEKRHAKRLNRLIYALYYCLMSKSEILCYFAIVFNHMNSASVLSLPIPLMTFLWGTLTLPKPSRLFWITLITYIQGMVIVKYVFQFNFFPWNKISSPDNPFYPPRILGIEKRDQFAAWDLILLVTLFIHRNNLMSIGLWDYTVTKLQGVPIRSTKNADSPLIEANVATNKDTAISNKAIERQITEEHSSENEKISRIIMRRFSTRNKNVAKKFFYRCFMIHRLRRRIFAFREFLYMLLNSVDRCPQDLYAPMFLCDAICFLIIIFGYSAFGTDSGGIHGGVTAYLEENKVPPTLVSMLIIQFVLIILDRAIFLRKFLFGKVVLQIIYVIFTHVWLFFLLPATTDRPFATNIPSKLFYFTKTVYFLISAKQIQSGYPNRSLGNIITKSYSLTNWFMYKVYLLIPFLFELRALMDWMWVDTSLGVGDWFTFNDIYAHLYMIKCERKIEEDYPSPKGVKKRPILKYGLGGCLLFFIILIIWFPLVIFSMANTVGTRSLPVECKCKLTISGFGVLYESTAQYDSIKELSSAEYDELHHIYRLNKVSLSYMADYDHEDVVKAVIDSNSQSLWNISPPSKASLIDSLNGSRKMSLEFEWLFNRADDEDLQFSTVKSSRTIELNVGDSLRNDLVEVISIGTNKSLHISNLFVPMVKVPGEGKADYVHALLSEHIKNAIETIEETFYDAVLELKSHDNAQWWCLRMIDKQFDPITEKEPKMLDHIEIYGFVDKVFPVTFSVITGGGILSLYLSMVLVFGRLMRSIVTGAMQKIMFQELPNVNRLLRLCLDISLVREAGELQLEENLFAKLIFVFRSPATLIKWTNEKRE